MAEVQVKIRLLDGSSVIHTFPESSTIANIYSWLQVNHNQKETFVLQNSYPLEVFGDSYMDKTLKSAGLSKQATLIAVKPGGKQANKTKNIAPKEKGFFDKIADFFSSNESETKVQEESHKPTNVKQYTHNDEEKGLKVERKNIEGMTKANVSGFEAN